MRGRHGRWRVALPWLADWSRSIGQGAARASLDWLLARADRAPAPLAWREWLLEGVDLGEDLLGRFPAGPCVRAAWTGAAPTGCWARAAPVHLLAALDHLRLAAPAPLPMEASESSALVAAINEQLAGSGFTLHAVPRGGWLCECAENIECNASEPAAAVGGNLRDWLPSGRDAGRVRAWINEAQMVLHEHPLNVRRAARGDPPVNSVWLWGLGSAGQPVRNTESVLVTDDDWLEGLWRLHGGRVPGPAGIDPGIAEAPDSATIRIAIVSGPDERSAADRPSLSGVSLFEKMRIALERGSVERVSIHAGSEVLDLDRRACWRFWHRPRPLSGSTK